MKKTYKIITLCMTLIMLIGTYSFAMADNGLKNKELNIVVKQKININPKLIDKETLQTLTETGWEITETNLIRLVPLEVGKILVDNEVIDVEDSFTKIKQDSNYAYFTEQEEDLAKKIKLNPNKNSENIMFEVDMFDLIDKMDKSEESMRNNAEDDPEPWKGKEYGSKYYVGDWVHCNRFNGPNSDHIHYNKIKNPLKTLKNFTGSDCDVALSGSNLCVFSNHCRNKGRAAACSALVGSNDKKYTCLPSFHTHDKAPDFLKY